VKPSGSEETGSSVLPEGFTGPGIAHWDADMLSLPTVPQPPQDGHQRRLPSWLKRQLPRGNGNFFTEHLLRELRLETVCENARCPNRPECYSRRTATFMILGNVCTRPCGFCSVPRGTPEALEDDEPERVAEAAFRLGLRHVVITSVTRDDLADGGADHFYRCVLAVRQRTGAVVEVLTPDFLGNRASIDRVLEAAPEVFNHNTETVPRLYKKVRGRACYQRSLDFLRYVKERSPQTVTKSGLMLGLGETTDELLDVFGDLRAAGCDTLTLGQYLAPTLRHIPVARYVPVEEFDALAALARTLGFKQVVAGPFVRSSYHADEMVPPASAGAEEDRNHAHADHPA
jgi:lipoyl synthase